MDFHLYRIQVYYPAQKELYQAPPERNELLKTIIAAKPAGQIRKNQNWLIGNVEALGDDGVYFQIGRMRLSLYRKYKDGRFIPEQRPDYPNTHVFLNYKTEVCAICQDTDVAKTTRTTAHYLQKLLLGHEIAHKYRVDIDVNEINDPETLLQYVRTAYAIIGLRFKVSRPNAFDMDRLIYEPAQKAVSTLNAESLELNFREGDMDREAIEELVNCSAATGNDASVRLKQTRDERPMTRHLLKGDVSLPVDDISDIPKKLKVLERMGEVFKRIRGGCNGDNDELQ